MVVPVVAVVATMGALAADDGCPNTVRDSANNKKGRCRRWNQGRQSQTPEMHSERPQCLATQGSKRPFSRQPSPRKSAAFATALAKSQDYEARILNHLHFENKVESVMGELRPIAGGSPNGDGKHWLMSGPQR